MSRVFPKEATERQSITQPTTHSQPHGDPTASEDTLLTRRWGLGHAQGLEAANIAQ